MDMSQEMQSKLGQATTELVAMLADPHYSAFVLARRKEDFVVSPVVTHDTGVGVVVDGRAAGAEEKIKVTRSTGSGVRDTPKLQTIRVTPDQIAEAFSAKQITEPLFRIDEQGGGTWLLNDVPLEPPMKTKGLNRDVPTNWTPFRTEQSIIREAKAGVSGSRIKAIASTAGLTNHELAPVLQLSERSLQRIRPDDVLVPTVAERLLLLDDVLRYGAANVFGTHPKQFAIWLRTELDSLGDTPLRIMQSTLGFNLIKEKLNQLTFTVY